MKTIFFVCGAPRSGKTNTLKNFFNVSNIPQLPPMQLLDKPVDGKKVYAVGLTSPQELTNEAFRFKEESGFCKYEEVIKRIKKRIKKCELKDPNIDYALLIPCTFFMKDGIINEKCITEPMKWLESGGFRVFVIHLRREEKNPSLDLEDALMKSLRASVIKSNKEYERQAKELEGIIRKLDP
jgi:hypothetical protein